MASMITEEGILIHGLKIINYFSASNIKLPFVQKSMNY